MNVRRLQAGALWVALLAIVGAGCSKDDADKESPDKASAFHKPIVAQLEAAGLKSAGFEQTAARPYQAKACFRGEVSQLDVLICQYGDAAAAKKNQGTLEPFLAGAMSGATRGQDTVALAVADRKKKDIKGEKINKLLAAFAGKK